MTVVIQNFGRNVLIEAESLFRVESEAEVLAVLQSSQGKQVRAIGSLHAWSNAADTDGVVIEMQGLNAVEVSDDRASVWVGAGCKVKRLLRKLSRHGLTLPSVGLIDEQTVAGATATGTHGSGSNSLSHFIKSVRVAHYNSEGDAILTTIDSGEELRAARCSLGLLGVIVAIEFECRKEYNIEEHARAHNTLRAAIAMEASYPQQQFYLMPWAWGYFGHHRVETDQKRSWLATLYRLYCFFVIDVGLHVAVTFLSRIWKSTVATRFFFKRILPLTIAKNWKVVDDSHAMLVMEHDLFRHIEIEVFVPRNKVQQATDLLIDVLCVFGGQQKINAASSDPLLDSVNRKDELNTLSGSYCHHYPICYRRVLPDDTLLSSSSPGDAAALDEDWYAISFISYQLPDDREGFFKFANFIGPLVANVFGGRCHWGKYNPLTRADNEMGYAKMESFRKVSHRFDPNGFFSNDWFDKIAN
jgi:FAD/FMN-containing dehydrogenase